MEKLSFHNGSCVITLKNMNFYELIDDFPWIEKKLKYVRLEYMDWKVFNVVTS